MVVIGMLMLVGGALYLTNGIRTDADFEGHAWGMGSIFIGLVIAALGASDLGGD